MIYTTTTKDASQFQQLCLLGFGKVGQALYQRLSTHPHLHVSHIIVREPYVEQVKSRINKGTTVLSEVPAQADLLLECADQSAILEHVLPALHCGIECALMSTAALAQEGLAENLADAAQRGGTQVHLLPGAMAGIDAIAAAKRDGLQSVAYTGRFRPSAWRAELAPSLLDVDALIQERKAHVFLQASAREAAMIYPKLAHAAAAIGLAGLGFDATQVQLIADPTLAHDMHEVQLQGRFGSMRIELHDDDTSSPAEISLLAVLNAQRFIENRVSSIVI